MSSHVVASAARPACRLERVTKRFPGVTAVRDATLELRRGEVHGIIGKNGAGKSVLVSLIAGALRPTDGSITIRDQKVDAATYTPQKAHELGVALVPQEPLVAPLRSVVDNLFLGAPLRRRGLLDHRAMCEKVRAVAKELSLDVTPHQPIGELPIEDQQLLAFGKAVFIEGARVVLLDEITASLPRERKRLLLRFLRDTIARDPDICFVLITHHIDEVIEFCDRVTVMRDGSPVATVDVASTTKEQLAHWIVGDNAMAVGDHLATSGRAEPKPSDSQPVLEVRQLTAGLAFQDVTLTLHHGEVVGLAGLDGSGKDEFLMSLCGLYPPDRGEVLLDGRPIRPRKPSQAMRHGIVYLPKKREESATIHSRSVEENILVSLYPRLRNRWGLLDLKEGRRIVRERLRKLPVKTPSLDADVDTLSGGNRQKVMINRLAATRPRVYLLNEPTRGVDIASKPEILRTVRDELGTTSAVLLTLESEEEMIDTCDRILVFYRGRVVREIRRGEPDFTVGEVYRSAQGVGVK